MKNESVHAPLIGILRLSAGNARRTAAPHGAVEALGWAGNMSLAADALEECARDLEATREECSRLLRVHGIDDDEPAELPSGVVEMGAPPAKRPRRGRPPRLEPVPVIPEEDAAAAGIAAAAAPAVVTP